MSSAFANVTKKLRVPSTVAALSIAMTPLQIQHANALSFRAENYSISSPSDGLRYANLKPTADLIKAASIDDKKVTEANMPSQVEMDSQLTLETTFNELSKKWKLETSGLTSVASMVMHPAYLEIISHGEQMIPYILEDLQKKPTHWFIALKTLARNYSPVKPEDAGNIKKMTEAWLAWGKANGKIS